MLSSHRNLVRLLHVGRVIPEIDASLAKGVANRTINPKLLRTRRKLGMVRLPARLEIAATNKIQKISDSAFRKDVNNLVQIIGGLKVPDDKSTLKIKRAEIITELELREKIKDPTEYDPSEFKLNDERSTAKEELNKLIEGTLEDRTRDWHYYEYDERAACLYMATRLATNYAAIQTVMQEIKAIDASFKPESVLDFGSGMGTTIWAVNNVWPNITREFTNIDISTEQHHLCEYLLRGGDEFADIKLNVTHRQYLPLSRKVSHNLIVAAFTMLELPTMDMRIKTIENLWDKTEDILVIIERGNEGGFSVINEARSFILDLTGHDVTKKINLSLESKPRAILNPPGSHVLAPCPHDYFCPKTLIPNKNKNVCKFKVVTEPIDYGRKRTGHIREEFSYVVLRKGPHPSYSSGFRECPRWPRIIAKIKKSSGKRIHNLCCPDGNLAEVTFTKRYGKSTYEVAKSSDWGDVLPMRLHQRAPSPIESDSGQLPELLENPDSQPDQ